jgi:hypothetical protein
MEQQKRTARPLRLSDPEAAPIITIAAAETEGNFSMAIRKLINEALAARSQKNSKDQERIRGEESHGDVD